MPPNIAHCPLPPFPPPSAHGIVASHRREPRDGPRVLDCALDLPWISVPFACLDFAPNSPQVCLKFASSLPVGASRAPVSVKLHHQQRTTPGLGHGGADSGPPPVIPGHMKWNSAKAGTLMMAIKVPGSTKW